MLACCHVDVRLGALAKAGTMLFLSFLALPWLVEIACAPTQGALATAVSVLGERTFLWLAMFVAGVFIIAVAGKVVMAMLKALWA